MRKLIFLLLCLTGFTFQEVQAQEFSWSNLERFRNRTSYNEIIGSNEDGYYVLRSRNRELETRLIIERFRPSLGKDYSKKLPGMKKYRLHNAFVNQNGLVLFKSRFNPAHETIDLYFQRYNNDAEPDSQARLLVSAVPKSYTDNGDFFVVTNDNKSLYFLTYTEPGPKKKVYISFLTFDNRGNILNRQKQLLDFDLENFEREQMLLDTAGNAFLLVRGLNEKFKEGSPEQVGYHLFSLKAAENSWHTYYLNFSDTYLSNPRMQIDRIRNKLVVTGLYSLESNEKSRGILDFGLLLDDFKVAYHNFVPYNLSFVQDVIGEKAAGKGEEMHNFLLRKVVCRSDGGYIIIGEEFFISQQSYTYYINGIPQISSRSIFNYGKIFTLSVNPEGKIEWTRIINKGQSSLDDLGHYSSFTTMLRKDKILLMFNDKMRGIGDVLLYTLDNFGKMESQMLFKDLNAYVSIIPWEAEQLDLNTLLIPTSKDRKFAFVKITF